MCGPATSDAGERTAGTCRLRTQGILTLWLSVVQVNPVGRIGKSCGRMWSPLAERQATVRGQIPLAKISSVLAAITKSFR